MAELPSAQDLFKAAAMTIRGIALAAKIKEQQFNLKSVTGKATTAPERETG